MAHCAACDCLLTDIEATRKDIHGDYVELCNVCIYPIRKEIALSNNFDLNIVEQQMVDFGDE
jgi:hypothetical protein